MNAPGMREMPLLHSGESCASALLKGSPSRDSRARTAMGAGQTLVCLLLCVVVATVGCGGRPGGSHSTLRHWESPLAWSKVVAMGAVGEGGLPRVIRRDFDGRLMQLVDWTSAFGPLSDTASGLSGEIGAASEMDPVYVDINPILNRDVVAFVNATGYTLDSDGEGVGLSIGQSGEYVDSPTWQRWRPARIDARSPWMLQPAQLLTLRDLHAMAKWIGCGLQPPPGATSGQRVGLLHFRRPMAPHRD